MLSMLLAQKLVSPLMTATAASLMGGAAMDTLAVTGNGEPEIHVSAARETELARSVGRVGGVEGSGGPDASADPSGSSASVRHRSAGGHDHRRGTWGRHVGGRDRDRWRRGGSGPVGRRPTRCGDR